MKTIVLYVLADNGYPLGYRVLPRTVSEAMVCKIADALPDRYPNGEQVWAVVNKPSIKQAWMDTRSNNGRRDWTEWLAFRMLLEADPEAERIA